MYIHETGYNVLRLMASLLQLLAQMAAVTWSDPATHLHPHLPSLPHRPEFSPSLSSFPAYFLFDFILPQHASPSLSLSLPPCPRIVSWQAGWLKLVNLMPFCSRHHWQHLAHSAAHWNSLSTDISLLNCDTIKLMQKLKRRGNGSCLV